MSVHPSVRLKQLDDDGRNSAKFRTSELMESKVMLLLEDRHTRFNTSQSRA
jgi:hypothetical protein